MSDSDLGACCICETRFGVVNIVMLERRAPKGGRGWGCFVCGLTNDGAIAVLCDGCMELVKAGANPTLVCVGYPADNERVPFESLAPEPFCHDLDAHCREEGER